MTDETETPDTGTPEPAADGTPARKRRWPRAVAVLAVAAAVLAAAVTFVPSLVARHLLAGELEALGIDAEGLDTLAVDVWSSEVWFGPVAFGIGDGEPAHLAELGLAYDAGALFGRRAVARRLTVRGLDVRIERGADGAIDINGMPLARLLPGDGSAPADPEPADGAGWHLGLLDLKLRDGRATLAEAGGGEIAVAIARLDLRDFQSWRPDAPGTFSLDAAVNDIAVTWEGEARPFAERIAVTADGRIDGVRLDRIERYTGPLGFDRRQATLDTTFRHQVEVAADGRIEVRSRGAATVSGIDLAHEGGVAVEGEAVAAEIDTVVVSEAPGRLRVTGAVSVGLQGVAVTAGGSSAGVDTARVTASGLRAEGGGAGGWRLVADPRITVEGATLAGPVDGGVGRLDLDAEGLAVGLAGGETTASVNAATAAAEAVRLDLGGLAGLPPLAVTADGARADVAAASLALADDALAWRAGMGAEITGVGAALADAEAGRLDIGRIEARGFEADQSLAVTGEALVVAALRAVLTDRALAALPPGDADDADDAGASGDRGAAGGTAPAVRLGTVTFTDGAHVTVRDGSVEPVVEADVRFAELEIRDIDTADPSRAMAVHLAGTVNEFAEVTADGTLTPLKAEPDFDLAAAFRNVELHPLSPYAERLFGTRLDSGRLTVEAAGTAVAGALRGQADLDLLGVAFEPLSAEDAERLSDDIGAPIEAVVGLLEDGEGRITLTLPVAGTVAEPEVDLSEAIGKAVGGVLSRLFPPTAIAGLLSDLGSGGGLFPPVVFAPNSAALEDAGRGDADDLVALLAERPKLSIKVCGRATKADLDTYTAAALETAAEDLARARPAAAGAGPDKAAAEAPPVPDVELLIRQAEPVMRELAAQRTVAFRRYLADGKGIAAERVSECRPDYDPADAGLPRVDVRL